jgi:hypothetical protein
MNTVKHDPEFIVKTFMAALRQSHSVFILMAEKCNTDPLKLFTLINSGDNVQKAFAASMLDYIKKNRAKK